MELNCTELYNLPWPAHLVQLATPPTSNRPWLTLIASSEKYSFCFALSHTAIMDLKNSSLLITFIYNFPSNIFAYKITYISK